MPFCFPICDVIKIKQDYSDFIENPANLFEVDDETRINAHSDLEKVEIRSTVKEFSEYIGQFQNIKK